MVIISRCNQQQNDPSLLMVCLTDRPCGHLTGLSVTKELNILLARLLKKMKSCKQSNVDAIVKKKERKNPYTRTLELSGHWTTQEAEISKIDQTRQTFCQSLAN